MYDIKLDSIPYHGRFGAIRKYDVHTGLDLYCDAGTVVTSIFGGLIVNICDFTGKDADSPWWNDTKAVLVESEVGVILYGEIVPFSRWRVGDFISEGAAIGYVEQVLKNDKGLPMNMLHLELYKSGYRGCGEWWKHEQPQPDALLNVEKLFI